MKNQNCIFCKIIAGEIPSVKIWEDEDFLAILDVFPNTKGQTLVMPKRHVDSDVFDLDDDMYTRYLLAVKRVVDFLKKGLGVQRVALVMEGMGVNHAHYKLYPLHGLQSHREPHEGGREQFFDTYSGYITTEIGPQATAEQLQEVAEEIEVNLKI